MANDIQLKRSSVSGRVPDAANVLVGEPVVNLADKIIFTKDGTGNVIVIGAGTTSNVVEGSNLYYSNARVYANVAPLLANISSGAPVYFQNTAPSAPVTGSFWINSDTNKEYLYFNDGSSSQWVEQATINYSSGTVPTTDNTTELTNLYYTNARVYANVTQIGYATNTNVELKANVADLTTANVAELNNLYFTNTRVYTYVSTIGYATNINVALKANVIDLTTANVAELTNLYFTNARAYSNVTQIGYATNTNVSLKANIVDLTTSNVTELTNLYFTNARVYANVTQIGYATNTNVDLKANVVDLTTSNVTEGTNLYFSNSRVVSAISNQQLANASFSGNVFVGGTLNIAGNLNVVGNITTFSSNVVEIADTMIYLGTGNSGDVQDIGFVGHFTNPDYQHTGLVRDASDGVWKLFANVQTEPTTNVLDFTTATYSTLKVGNLQSATATFTGNITAQDFTGTWGGKSVPTGNVVGTTDTQTLTNKVITDTVYTLTGTDVSASNGGMQVKTLSGSAVLTESLTNGQSVLLRLVNASTYAVTWPTITWVSSSGNVAPTLANDCHVVLWKSGSVLYGAYIGRSV